MDIATRHRASQTQGCRAVADGLRDISAPAVLAEVVFAGRTRHGGGPVLFKANVALHLHHQKQSSTLKPCSKCCRCDWLLWSVLDEIDKKRWVFL